MKILISLAILIPLFSLPISNKQGEETKIFYSFRDTVNNQINDIYLTELDELRKENVDSLNNYIFYIFLEKSPNCKNRIFIDYADTKSDYAKYAIASKIYFKMKSNELIPIVTNYDLAFNQKYQLAQNIRRVNIYDGRVINFDDYGYLIK
jgi:hypothetical protein